MLNKCLVACTHVYNAHGFFFRVTYRCEMSVCDLRARELETVDREDIGVDTECLLLSNNRLAQLSAQVFNGRYKMWDVDLSKNELRNVRALAIYKILHLLDLSDNCLELDDLLDLRPIFVFSLKLEGNPFDRFTNDNILFYIALLKRVWVIDGIFVTDYLRQRAKEFKKSMCFSETVLAARRTPITQHPTASSAVAASSFLAGTECKYHEPGVYANPHGTELRDLCKKPQIERLIYMWKSEKLRFDFPEPNEYEKLAMVCGILGHQWLGVPISTITKVVSRNYWSELSPEVDQAEHWEEFVMLLEFSRNINLLDEIPREIWATLNVNRYLETGKPPLVGAAARMVLCSMLFDSDVSDEELYAIPDMKCYDKMMTAMPVKETPGLLERVYHEVLEELPFELRREPCVNDIMSVRHPLTDKWVDGVISHAVNGRVYTTLGKKVIVHLPMTALFWDGKGKWREMRPSATEVKKGSNIGNTFLTIAEAVASTKNTKPDPRRYAVPLPPNKVSKRNVTPKDPTFFLRTSQSMMHTSPFVEKKRKLTEREKGFPSFRGIVDPVRPKTAVRKKAPSTRRPNQIIQGVINISLGDEIEPGRRIRKFHVKVQNMMSKKISYAWISEDEIPEEDVRTLVNMYRKLIESKMTILPNL